MKKKTTNKNFTGVKIGKLTYLRPTDKRSERSIIWEAICDCGNSFLSGDKRNKSCGCLRKENFTNRKHTFYISSARAVWRSSYRDGNFDTFLKLSQEPCYYCNRLPHRTYNMGNREIASQIQRIEGNFTYNGLDRLDSSKGHLDNNVVPCCYDCNIAKLDRSLDEFLIHIEAMYKHTRKLRTL